jgi:hypothetical protein
VDEDKGTACRAALVALARARTDNAELIFVTSSSPKSQKGGARKKPIPSRNQRLTRKK